MSESLEAVPRIRRTGLLVAVFLLCSLTGFALAQQAHPRRLVDERGHVEVIRAIVNGEFRFALMEERKLPMLPGYHAGMSLPARAIGDSLFELRSVSYLFALLLVPLAALAARAVGGPGWAPRFLQVLLIPVWPVMSWLVYTDVASLVLVLGGFLLWRKQRTGLAAVVLTTACLVRQNNLVWSVVFVAADLLEHAGGDVRRLPGAARARARALLPLLVPVLVIAVLVLRTGRLVSGSFANNPLVLHPSQVYAQAVFLLFYLAPAIVRDLRRQAREWRERIRARRFGWVLIAAALCAIYLTTMTPEALHPNNLRLQISDMLDIDDLVPAGISRTPVARTAGFALLWIVASFLAHLTATARKPWLLGSILVGAMLYFLPSWIISARYSLIPTSLLLLAADDPRLTDRTSRIWAAGVGVFLTGGFLTNTLFW